MKVFTQLGFDQRKTLLAICPDLNRKFPQILLFMRQNAKHFSAVQTDQTPDRCSQCIEGHFKGLAEPRFSLNQYNRNLTQLNDRIRRKFLQALCSEPCQVCTRGFNKSLTHYHNLF